MGKKNIKPQQQQPVIRYTTVKAVSGLTEENLGGGSSGFGQGHLLGAMMALNTKQFEADLAYLSNLNLSSGGGDEFS